MTPGSRKCLPIRVGDAVSMRRPNGSFLHADALGLDLSFSPPDDEAWDVDGEFYVFPWMLWVRQKRIQKAGSFSSRSSWQRHAQTSAQNQALLEANLQTLATVEAGRGDVLRFGDWVQFRHSTTGFWLQQLDTHAPLGRLGLSSAFGNEESKFRLMPFYRSQREGDVISCNTELLVCGNSAFSQYAIFESQNGDSDRPEAIMRCFDSTRSLVSFHIHFSVARRISGDESPSILDDDSRKPGRPHQNRKLLLYDRVPIALFHLEKQCYLSAEASSSGVSFRRVRAGDNSDYSGSDMWAFENIGQHNRGEQIQFLRLFRIRHVPTARYICALPLEQAVARSEIVNDVKLVSHREAEAAGFRSCFYVNSLNNSIHDDTTSVPSLESAVLVQQAHCHTVFSLGDDVVDDDNQHRQDCARLSTSRSSSSSNAFKLCLLNNSALLDARRVTALQLEVLAYKRNVVDCHQLDARTEGERDFQRKMQACRRAHHALAYACRFLLDPLFGCKTSKLLTELDNSDSALEFAGTENRHRRCGRATCDRFSVTFHQQSDDGYGNDTEDSASSITTDDEADADMETVDVFSLDGTPVEARQRFARDLGFMSVLMDLIMAPVVAGRLGRLPSIVHAVVTRVQTCQPNISTCVCPDALRSPSMF